MNRASRRSSLPFTAARGPSMLARPARKFDQGNVFRLTWRLQRNGLIGMSAFGIFYGILQAAAYSAAAGTTAASRRAFGQATESFGRQYSLLLPLPHGVDTI